MKKIIFLLLMSVIVFGIAMADNPVHPPGEITLVIIPAVLSENSVESYAVNSDTVLVGSEKTNQLELFMVLYSELAIERSISIFEYDIGYYLRC